jgi:hypothetical protein
LQESAIETEQKIIKTEEQYYSYVSNIAENATSSDSDRDVDVIVRKIAGSVLSRRRVTGLLQRRDR